MSDFSPPVKRVYSVKNKKRSITPKSNYALRSKAPILEKTTKEEIEEDEEKDESGKEEEVKDFIELNVKMFFEDSSVVRYLCFRDEDDSSISKSSKEESSMDKSLGSFSCHLSQGGFTSTNRVLKDANLSKIYSMHFKDELLIAGGHRGFVSVFGVAEKVRFSLVSFRTSHLIL